MTYTLRKTIFILLLPITFPCLCVISLCGLYTEWSEKRKGGYYD